MPTHAVDFSLVPHHQREIDARLANWAKWSYGRAGATASPMFRLYRSSDAAQQYGAQTAEKVDAIDAQRMQKAITALPAKHRQALSWAYIKRTNPRKAAASLGLTMQELADMVTDARQMLINRHA